MTILVKTLRDRRRAMVAWSIGLVALTTLIFAYWPSVRDNRELERFVRDLPEAVRALTGEGSLATPSGYLNAELFALMIPLLLLVVAIGMGARAIAGEEERGTLELLLAAPVSRRRVVLEKVSAGLIVLCVLGATLALALVLQARGYGMEIGTDRLAAAALSAVALSLPFGALSLALGCVTGLRGASVGLATAAAAAAYLLDALAPLSSTLEPYRALSPFHWYGSDAVLVSGARWGYLALLVGTAAALVAVATLAFERRDVA